MVYFWNILDIGVLSVVENEVEVIIVVYLLYLKMEMMVFLDGNCKLKVCLIIYNKDYYFYF